MASASASPCPAVQRSPPVPSSTGKASMGHAPMILGHASHQDGQNILAQFALIPQTVNDLLRDDEGRIAPQVMKRLDNLGGRQPGAFEVELQPGPMDRMS